MTNKTLTTIGNIFTGIVNLILMYLIVASYVDMYKATTGQDAINAMTTALIWMTVATIFNTAYFFAWLRYEKKQARFRAFANHSQMSR